MKRTLLEPEGNTPSSCSNSALLMRNDCETWVASLWLTSSCTRIRFDCFDSIDDCMKFNLNKKMFVSFSFSTSLGFILSFLHNGKVLLVRT